MVRRHLECKVAVTNDPAGCKMLSLRMSKWKSWLMIVVIVVSSQRENWRR
jgi:hypothetical protein